MGAFNTGNPTLTEKIFDKSVNDTANAFGTMSVRGTMYKFGFTLLLLIASASYTWSMFDSETPATVNIYMMVGGIGGFIMAMIIIFKPTLAPYIVPAYAIFEGLFIGGISAFFNAVFSEKLAGGSNIILNAVGLTLGVAIVMFLLYNFRIIKVTDRLRSIVISATMVVGLFYLITWIIGYHFGNDLLSIGISLFVVGLAAFNLLLDFDSIEKAAEMGAPKYMEWYGAFGFMVTLVWLYQEILRLLAKLNSRD